ncbi:glutathione S-transferase [Aliishimia ponticola]|uniref:Glutathione S-transferase n=1 Tax=Aliishimia ponticola TaxID=2499833 RepID=A0A4S4N9U2_9RHOB|nr:glutathione S-transferase [Aliishimia ponticola]THH34771.1 glutathione S-transferase [Aliishimia ponticola]
MQLYYSPTSPYVRKVMITLHETGQLDDVTLIEGSTKPTNPLSGLAAQNPLMKIPALTRADGPTLYDSRVICAFFDDRAQAGLYASGSRRFEIMTLEATADGILDAALLMTYEGKLRPEEARWDDWVEAQWTKIASACAALDSRWMGHLNGPLDMGQIAVACALGYVDFRHDARNWRKGCDALAKWYAEFAQRPSMLATVPPEGM